MRVWQRLLWVLNPSRRPAWAEAARASHAGREAAQMCPFSALDQTLPGFERPHPPPLCAPTFPPICAPKHTALCQPPLCSSPVCSLKLLLICSDTPRCLCAYPSGLLPVCVPDQTSHFCCTQCGYAKLKACAEQELSAVFSLSHFSSRLISQPVVLCLNFCSVYLCWPHSGDPINRRFLPGPLSMPSVLLCPRFGLQKLPSL